jgi:nucleoside 2-deoxyribosyltransferase
MESMKIYLAGPMRGIPEFNFPKFHRLAAELRSKGFTVFNPAERDIERHNGVDVSKGNTTGDESIAAKEHNFSLRDALRDDLVFITQEADAIYMMDGWRTSKGAIAEHATAHALGLLRFYESGTFEY